MEQESVWSKSFTTKEQMTILKRIIKFASPFKLQFSVGILFGVLLALQTFFCQGFFKFLLMSI